MKILDKFDIYNARSKSYKYHETGNVAFVSNGFYNNGVIGFVEPIKNERMFNEVGICVSAFCEATVQTPPFIPRGNGGSGLIVLIPKEKMNDDDLYCYAAQINKYNWRFSFGRMVIADRLKDFLIVERKNNFDVNKKINELVPKKQIKSTIEIKKKKTFNLTELCNIKRAYAPYLNQLNLSNKKIPYVTTTEMNNGVALWCDEDPLFEKGSVTVSLDGLCGTSFYQFDDFISGEKTGVLTLKEKNNPFLLMYVSIMIRISSWRYHYGRKLSMKRLKDMKISVPVDDNGNIDYELLKTLVTNSYGSDLFLKYA
jgi:hypothetical protein